MDERLGREDLSDRRCEGRRSGFCTDQDQLVEDLVEPVGGAVRAQPRVHRRDEPCGQLVLGRPNRDPRRQRRHGLVADVLVDQLRGLPERVHVDAGVEVEPGQRRGKSLPRHAVEQERDRIDGTGKPVGSGASRLEVGSKRVPGRTLAVHADRQPTRLGKRRDQFVRPGGSQSAGCVVEKHSRGAEVRQLLGLLDQLLGPLR